MFKIKSHYFTSIGAGTYSLFICLQNIVCKNTRVVDILTESNTDVIHFAGLKFSSCFERNPITITCVGES